MKYLNTAEAANYRGVSKNSIYSALKNGRLKYSREGTSYKISLFDLLEYVASRYSRRFSKVDGETLYDIEKGTYDIKTASEVFSCSIQKLYYGIRKNLLPYTRKRSSYVLNEDDILRFLRKN